MPGCAEGLTFRTALQRRARGAGPDRAVLQGVYGTLVADWLVVVAAVLPDRVVRPPNGRTLLVVHFASGVLSGRTHIVGLYVLRSGAARLLSGVEHCEGDEPCYEHDDNRAYYQVCPSGAIRPAASSASLCQNFPLSSPR